MGINVKVLIYTLTTDIIDSSKNKKFNITSSIYIRSLNEQVAKLCPAHKKFWGQENLTITINQSVRLLVLSLYC